ncbi:UNVERIFIED_CONTAM: hypothetical protein RMT77_001095 [Armadillidium vulgare]
MAAVATSVFKLENFIGGNFVPCHRYIDSFEPATGKVLLQIPDSGSLEVDAAVAAASKAFLQWSSISIERRAEYLLKVADILEEQLEEFAVAESRDQGKPVWLARNLDIPRAVKNFRHFASTTPHILGTSKELAESNTLCYTTRNPIGVAGLISPWNLPLYLLTFKIAPALICGNTVVAKPSEMTSLTAYKLCKVFKDAGVPDGVLNIVFGLGPSVGQSLVVHPEVPLISFTGSTVTGRAIAQATAPYFKKLSLEMGGKNAAILFADCDLQAAYKCLIRSSFINQGQVCLCTSRIFVQKDIYDIFVKEFVEQTRKIKVGDPKEEDSFLGALNSLPHLEKVRGYVKLALQEGGTIHCGETVDQLNLKEENKQGYFMLPTVITGLKDNTRCMQEEIFGPVTSITPFDTEEEVIERVNGTAFGLCASVWSTNNGTVHRVAKKLKVGTVWTNCWLVRDIDLPFGGVKGSGIGREGTKDSFEFFTESKSICCNIE